MKRKLSTLVLTAAVLLSLNVPALAVCERTPMCGDTLLWQLLLQCCTQTDTARCDWDALLRQWLAPPQQPASEAEIPKTPEKPATPVQPAVPTEPAAPEETPQAPAGTDADDTVRAYEKEVVRLVNVERAKYGLAALNEDETLCDIARAKSQDMHDRGYFDHNSPVYGTPFQMMKAFGISYRTAGENIAMGYRTPEAVVSAWMNSEGHRANILNASYTSIGVGYVADGNYWTQHFIG